MVSERRGCGRPSPEAGPGSESGRSCAQALPASLPVPGARAGVGGNGLCTRRGETGESGHVLRLAAAKFASAPSTCAEPLAAHPWSVEAPRPGSGERPLGVSQLLPLVGISRMCSDDTVGETGAQSPLWPFNGGVKTWNLCR